MAITITQERKRQRYLVLALVAIIFITLAILWFRFLKKQEAVVFPASAIVIYAVPEVSIDWQLLEEVGAGTPQPFKGISALGNDFGRKNPFMPY